MNSTQSIRAMAIFDKLQHDEKIALYHEILNLGLRIELGETTWHKHARQRAKTAKGNVSRFFSLATNFTPLDVQVFLDAFSNVENKNVHD